MLNNFHQQLLDLILISRNVFFDKKSKDDSVTYKDAVKKKYLLYICKQDLFDDIRVFLWTTSKIHNVQGSHISVDQNEWEDLLPNHLQGTSLIDIVNITFLNEKEIFSKRHDSRNGFKTVAKLSQNKFDDLGARFIQLENRNIKNRTHINLAPALSAFAKEFNIDPTHKLKELGL